MIFLAVCFFHYIVPKKQIPLSLNLNIRNAKREERQCVRFPSYTLTMRITTHIGTFQFIHCQRLMYIKYNQSHREEKNF